MIDKVKIVPEIILIPEGRASFLNHVTATYRTDKFGREIKVRPDGKPVKPQYRMTWLLDPTQPAAQETIKKIKTEAARQLDIYHNGRANWPQDNKQTGTKGILLCFGNGNDLPKVYDGYKDMFFIKASDTTAPFIVDQKGRLVRFGGDNAWHVVDRKTDQLTDEIADSNIVPYGGAYCRGKISLYIYNNESHGINANFRSIQYVRYGEGFGAGRRSASDELDGMTAMAGDAPGAGKPPVDNDMPF
jgi:hypothetical protein